MDTRVPSAAIDVQALTAEDIEAAYERALAAMDSVEVGVEELAATAGDSRLLTDDESPPLSPARLGVPKSSDEAEGPLMHSREVIEAALFVGGQALTTKRLSHILSIDHASERIGGYVAELNAIYQEENRPYRIDFGQGGYHLVLLPEYEPVRNSVFGAGPKEIKLSQEVLEVLAFVAYRQPTTQAALEAAGQEKAAAHLRQLLRRELIALSRIDDGEVTYGTTPRFLDVFGLRTLDDLPFPEDLELK